MNCWISSLPGVLTQCVQARIENTAATCGLCRVIRFLSCKDTDVAKALRRRCVPVTKRIYLTRPAAAWRRARPGWQDVGWPRWGSGGIQRGHPPRTAVSCRNLRDVLDSADLRKNSRGVTDDDRHRDRAPQIFRRADGRRSAR